MSVERPVVARLDPAVISKIAAGEMILRPFSVAKELLENALDAQSTAVEIAIGNRADELLVITDNGIGMTPDDLGLALESHATSKLRAEEDLLRVGSLGFRGEAVPAIGRVSRMEITTAWNESGEGRRVVVEGGHRRSFEPAPRSRGTTIRVEDLFFNSPVRKRFLKSPGSETRMITRLLHTYALAFPDVSFRLTVRSQPTVDLPRAEGLAERVGQIHGPEFIDKVLTIEGASPQVSLFGVVGVPELARPGTQHQTLLVNRRWVTAPWFTAALRQAFGDLIPGNRNPFAAVLLELDPSRVDVNVHPTKREVRFLDESLLFSEVVRAIREQTEQLIPTWNLDPNDRGGGWKRSSESGGSSGFGSGTGGGSLPETAWTRPPAVDALTGQGVLEALYGPAPDRVAESASETTGSVALGQSGAIDIQSPHTSDRTDEAGSSDEPTTTEREPESPVFHTEPDRPLVPLWQLHTRYIFAQTRQGLLIIDQHAAHERVLYEQTLAQLQEAPATTQQLLFPVVVHLEPEEWQSYQDYQTEMLRLGIYAEEFGEKAVLLRGVPTLWSQDPEGLFRELLQEVSGKSTRGTEDRFEQLAAGFACRSAIKSGRSLTLEEMNALVDQLFATRVPHGDPHGRPTFIQISMNDLDRRFGRH